MSGRKSDNHPRRKPIRRGWIIGIRELLFAQFIKGDTGILHAIGVRRSIWAETITCRTVFNLVQQLTFCLLRRGCYIHNCKPILVIIISDRPSLRRSIGQFKIGTRVVFNIFTGTILNHIGIAIGFDCHSIGIICLIRFDLTTRNRDIDTSELTQSHRSCSGHHNIFRIDFSHD